MILVFWKYGRVRCYLSFGGVGLVVVVVGFLGFCCCGGVGFDVGGYLGGVGCFGGDVVFLF